MAFELQDFTSEDNDYIEKHNNNNALLEAEINDLRQKVLAAGGEGAQLLLDLFDRDGIVGSTSYVLDLDGYSGGPQITIGRRPSPTPAYGELDVSVAWGTFGGQKSRVFQTGDVVLDATPITNALPKTIYVGIPSGGTAQLFETILTPNVLFVYSITWDGFGLSNFKRLAPILPGYSAVQAIAGAPRLMSIFDSESDWVSDEEGSTEIAVIGASDDNAIGIEGSVEILGFFLHAARPGDDGFSAPGGVDPETVSVALRVVSEGETWTLDALEVDASNIPDVVFSAVDVGLVGDKRYVTTIRRFSLERVSIGGNVVSARAFTWGAIVRPLHGVPLPKDTNRVEMI